MREITGVHDSVESHRLFCDGEVRDITSDEHAERDELDPWRLDAAHVAAGLGTDVRRGLTFAEAAARLGRYGPNELEPEAAVPARLRAIVTRATQPEPAARYGSVEELGADVRRFQDGQPVRAYREPMHERAARLISKYRTPILLVLSYLIVRILLIAFAGE